MKGVVIIPENKLALADVEEPKLKQNSDAIVRITAAAICGSDVHAKHGLLPGVGPGTLLGHEFVGVIEEVGSDVTRFKPGDRVNAAPATWCGKCAACRRGDYQYCSNGGVWGGGEIFGKGLPGAQTSHIRVTYADNCLASIPDNIADEQAVFVGDVFSTGFHAAYEGSIKTGDIVVVYGCGPIGLGALVSAWQFGPKEVFCVDMLQNRLDLARQFGAKVIDVRDGDPAEQIRDATHGEGCDVAIEAIGFPQAFTQALRSVRRGGTVSVVGLFPTPVELPVHELSFYGVRISMGLGNLSRMNSLMGLLESGRVDLTPLATHAFALDQALEAYDLVENHKEQCLKVLLKP
ncbi:MAG: alcohol dehydrogenase catalytic domain-containing protein [Syntrophorhabdus aromaticivorans]|uniref:Alcohol dehydrogenase catalytic domain-containing protein n=1 Tax=Syntrophorhabdus aromaticivorans TaxID=328301 RepID=A0A351TZ60_9BACT|nr:alcohol dehydrogenase catalytic domain-containing protein [Syntrophorhabdus aromaticivorans]HBA52991.1 alcohol dehydrogenase [Syntrophorhabdus aromaticivorans]